MGIDLDKLDEKMSGKMKVQAKISCSKEGCTNRTFIEVMKDFEDVNLNEYKTIEIEEDLQHKVILKAEECGWGFPSGFNKNFCPKHSNKNELKEDLSDGTGDE